MIKNIEFSSFLEMDMLKDWVFWGSCLPSTVPVHGRTPENQSNFPGYGQGSLNICVRTLHAKDMFRELPWGSTLNNYFWDEGDLGLYWTVEMDLALVLVLVLMLVLMLVLVSVWVLK